MAISNFVLPTGLEVSGTTTITGSVGVSQTLTAVNLTASGDISGSVGNYGSLFVNGSAVLTSVGLAGYALSADVSSSFVQPSQVSASYVTPAQVSASFAQPADVSASFAKSADVSASFVQPSQVTGAVAFLTASNVFTVSQQITGGLSMTGDLLARTGSLLGDLTVGGNLTVRGTTTYIDSTTVNIGDKNINIGTGSSDLAVLSGGGLDLGTGAEVQWRYSNTAAAWTANVGVSSSVDLKAPAATITALTGTTTTGSFAKFGDITGSFVSGTRAQFTSLSGALSSSAIIVSDIAAVSYGSFPLNTIVGVGAGGTGSLTPFIASRAGAVKYILNASGSSGNHHALEVLVTHSGSTPFYTSYASLYTGVPMIRVTASITTLPVVGNVVTVGAENISGETINVGYLINYVY